MHLDETATADEPTPRRGCGRAELGERKANEVVRDRAGEPRHEITAKGIATPEQLDWMLAVGCAEVQGSCPAPPN